MKKIGFLLMLVVLLAVMFAAPVVAYAQTGEAVSTQEAVADFIIPLAWLIPLIVAVVNRFKAGEKPLPDWLVIAFSAALGIIVVAVAIYFPDLPLVAKVVVGGVVLGLSASGVFDLFKLLGTITPGGDA